MVMLTFLRFSKIDIDVANCAIKIDETEILDIFSTTNTNVPALQPFLHDNLGKHIRMQVTDII